VPTAHLDDKHVVFGEVIRGKSIVRQIEALPTGAQDAPAFPVTITASGALEPDDPSLDRAASAADGDVYEDHPDDDETHNTQDPAVALQIATSLRAIGAGAWKEGDSARALAKWTKALRYLDVHPVFSDGDEVDDETKKAFEDARRALLLNAALAALKAGENARALEFAEKVLRREIPDTDKGTCAFHILAAASPRPARSARSETMRRAPSCVSARTPFHSARIPFRAPADVRPSFPSKSALSRRPRARRAQRGRRRRGRAQASTRARAGGRGHRGRARARARAQEGQGRQGEGGVSQDVWMRAVIGWREIEVGGRKTRRAVYL
jgi:hypothetical protein